MHSGTWCSSWCCPVWGQELDTMNLVGPFTLRILFYDSKHNFYMLCLLALVGPENTHEEPQMFWKWNSFSELYSFSSFSMVLERKFLTCQSSPFQAGPLHGLIQLPFYFVQKKGRESILSSSNYFSRSEDLILLKIRPAACRSRYTPHILKYQSYTGEKKRHFCQNYFSVISVILC